MSLDQFATFYWPGLKKLILALIDAGLTPCPFFEGTHTQRLQYYAELPKGKVLGLFDNTDIYKAKEILGNTMCMSGFRPLFLLQAGTPEKVRAYAKKLIDVVGKDDGFIMGPRSAMDEADPKLVKVWFDFTKKYGRYG
jgi:uroporphyrinogen-III decarboxylase